MPHNDPQFLVSLQTKDPDVFRTVQQETHRQEEGLELIASENYVSKAVLEAQGSILTNKYAEGYPSKRYYGGCEYMDIVENIAIKRACELFGAEHANVQPHSGSQANMAAYFSLLKPGEKILGMNLSQGGHLTHGSPVNFSGRLYQVIAYGVNPNTQLLDYNLIRELALKERPKVIIAGASAYPRIIQFNIFGEIAREAGAELVVDMAHIAGLVAAKLHPSPIPHATLTTSTTHKTLRGPRSGFILGSQARIQEVNKQIFPGIQGGPLMHVIAAKAVAFGEALQPSFVRYQKQILLNTKTLADGLLENGLALVTGGTDNHLLLVDLTSWEDGAITGKDAEQWLGEAGITVNKNTIPNEKRSPFVTSGLRIGTAAVTTRGMGINEMKQIARWIFEVIESRGEAATVHQIRQQVLELCKIYPVYQP